jgi:integrase
VIAIYLRDCADRQARPEKLIERCTRLIDFFEADRLIDVPRRSTEYATTVTKKGKTRSGGARRDLEDLRAAIRHHARQGYHRGEIPVALPEKGLPRDRWLTREEAAKLLWTVYRKREKQRGQATRKWTMRHVARFMLIALYTGTRAGAIAAASWHASSGRSYVDLDSGLFYRRRQGARETRKRQPPVPLPARLLAHMRRWKRIDARKDRTEGYVVEHHGQPVVSIKTAMKSAVKLAKLSPPVTPHTFRHTAATWLMQRGVSLWPASGFLGMSVTTLERVYGHHHPDYMRQAADAITSRPATARPQIPHEQNAKDAVERKQGRR